MEQKRGEETKKQERPLDILGQDEMRFIRGGDDDPPSPPPVENGDDKDG